MRQTSFAEMHCSLARTLEAVGDWWSPLIIRDVFLGLDRFDQLVDDLGISRALLSARLETLVETGVLEREQYTAHPPRHRYRLTEAGRDLVPVLIALTAWGDRWRSPDGPPILFRHSACGEVAAVQVSCSGCGAPVTEDELIPLPGPGGREAPGTVLVARLLTRRLS